MDLGLKDKTAVITGGSVRIGLVVAEGLAKEGVHLILCARNEERVGSEAKQVGEKYGVSAIGVKADITKSEDIASSVHVIGENSGKIQRPSSGEMRGYHC